MSDPTQPVEGATTEAAPAETSGPDYGPVLDRMSELAGSIDTRFAALEGRIPEPQAEPEEDPWAALFGETEQPEPEYQQPPAAAARHQRAPAGRSAADPAGRHPVPAADPADPGRASPRAAPQGRPRPPGPGARAADDRRHGPVPAAGAGQPRLHPVGPLEPAADQTSLRGRGGPKASGRPGARRERSPRRRIRRRGSPGRQRRAAQPSPRNLRCRRWRAAAGLPMTPPRASAR
jgi:hypothetical protein